MQQSGIGRFSAQENNTKVVSFGLLPVLFIFGSKLHNRNFCARALALALSLFCPFFFFVLFDLLRAMPSAGLPTPMYIQVSN